MPRELELEDFRADVLEEFALGMLAAFEADIKEDPAKWKPTPAITHIAPKSTPLTA